MRVLLIDDEESVRHYMALMLRRHGHEVITYSDPSQCPYCADDKNRCADAPPCADVLLTDNNMPFMSGIEFIRQRLGNNCRTLEKNRAMMSADWNSKDLAAAKELGCRIFDKPIDMQALCDWLDDCQLDSDRLQSAQPTPASLVSRTAPGKIPATRRIQS